MSGDDRSATDRDGAARRRAAGGVPPGRMPEGADGSERADDATIDPPPNVDFEEPETSWIAEQLGRVGVFLGVAAVAVAVVGILLGAVGAAGLADIAFFLALGLVTVAMVLGALFQASAMTRSRGD